MRTPWMLLLPLLFPQALFAADADLNWVRNGDFVSREAWTGNALFVQQGRDGGRAAVLTVGTGQALKASDLTLKADPRNPWAGVLAVSLDDKPLAQSGRFVIFAAAKEENSGQVWNATRTALKDPGQAPVMEQWVKGTVTSKVKGKGTFAARTLDASGKPGKPLPTLLKHAQLTIPLSPKNASGYYEVIRR